MGRGAEGEKNPSRLRAEGRARLMTQSHDPEIRPELKPRGDGQWTAPPRHPPH